MCFKASCKPIMVLSSSRTHLHCVLWYVFDQHNKSMLLASNLLTTREMNSAIPWAIFEYPSAFYHCCLRACCPTCRYQSVIIILLACCPCINRFYSIGYTYTCICLLSMSVCTHLCTHMHVRCLLYCTTLSLCHTVHEAATSCITHDEKHSMQYVVMLYCTECGIV